jgi:predicted DCC family thiol-disulfide oxidoreductase YuxK
LKRKATATDRERAAGARNGAATLVYDGTCGSCSWFARAVHTLDTHASVRLATLQDPEVRSRIAPGLGDRYEQSFHLIDEGTGNVRSGEDALLDLARLLPCVRPFAEVVFLLPGVRHLPRVFYRTAAAWRRCAMRPSLAQTDKVT